MIVDDMPRFRQEHIQAWNNWWKFWDKEMGKMGEKYEGHGDIFGGYRAFERFIGQNIFKGGPLSPEAAHRVQLLLSPHHYAILKAYKAKQEVS